MAYINDDMLTHKPENQRE